MPELRIFDKIDNRIYGRIEKYCEETSVRKTAVIERALCIYLDDYDETCKRLKQLKRN